MAVIRRISGRAFRRASRSVGMALELLTPAERRRLLRLGLLSVPIALLETFGLLSIMPLVALSADPGAAERHAALGAVQEALGLTGAPETFLTALGILFFGFFAAGIAGRYALSVARESFVADVAARMGAALFTGLLHQPLERHLRRNSTQQLLVVRDRVFAVGIGILLGLVNMLTQGTALLCLAAALTVMASAVSLGVGAAIGALNLGILLWATPRLKAMGRASMAVNDRQSTLARESLAGIRDLKALGAEDAFAQAFEEDARRIAGLRRRGQRLREAPRHAVEFLVFGALILVISLDLLTRMAPGADLAPLVAVMAFVSLRLKSAADQLFQSLARFRESVPALEAVHGEFAALVPAGRRRPCAEGAGAAPPALSALVLEGASFRHEGAPRPSVEGLDLRFGTGAAVAVVGASGAGKSTLADLLLGLIAPTAGRAVAILDGAEVPAAEMPAGIVGYVPQAPVFLDASIAENICLGAGRGAPDPARMRAAARIALLDEVVAALPEGYDTRLSEGAAALSGGQRQRLALARALYPGPQALVLDEATGALDPETRRRVLENLLRDRRADLLVFITHDPGVAAACGRVIALEEGRLVSDTALDAPGPVAASGLRPALPEGGLLRAGAMR